METEKRQGPLSKLLSGDNRIRLIVLLGVVGMLLVLLSQLWSSGEGDPGEVDAATAEFASEQYIDDLEAKLTRLIGEMDGVGEARVMVTLESGVEYIYLQEEKRNMDQSREDGTEQVSGKLVQKENVEQKYILVETQSGKKEPVLQTRMEPKVQGVVVVCEGASNPVVQQNLINVVTTALNIPSTRVCVVKIDPNELAPSHNERQMQEESVQ